MRLGVEEQIFGKLLGEGRAALHHMARHHVGDSGPRHADGIEPEMFAKAAVLDGDEGVGNIGGQVLDLDHLALGQAAPRDQAAAIVQDGDIARRPRGEKIFDIRQVGKKMRIEDRAENRAPGQQHDQHKGPGRFGFAAAAGARRLRRGARGRAARRLAAFVGRAGALPCPFYRTQRVNGC